MGRTDKTPAEDNCFHVWDKSKMIYLPEEQALFLHHIEPHTFFLSTTAYHDIQTDVAFFATWAKATENMIGLNYSEC